MDELSNSLAGLNLDKDTEHGESLPASVATNEDNAICVNDTLSQIYKDLDCNCRNEMGMVHGKSGPVLEGTHAERAYYRFKQLTDNQDYFRLSLLARSQTFRNALDRMNPRCWDSLSELVQKNALSFEIFARTRGIDWQAVLIQTAGTGQTLSHGDIKTSFCQSDVEINVGSAISYIVPSQTSQLCTPTFEGRAQIDIQQNIYDSGLFITRRKPSHWPSELPYPSDPTLRTALSEPCSSCGNEGKGVPGNEFCTCDPNTCAKVTRPLIELYDYGVKGTGIRTLQTIERGDALGEYVGVIVPHNYTQDPIYAFALTPWSGELQGKAVALISSKRYGNWTRYLNHSCRASLEFVMVTIGRHERVVVMALRDVEPFEELTIDYGEGYWRTRFCHCGEDCCYNGREFERMFNAEGEEGEEGEREDEDDEGADEDYEAADEEVEGDEGFAGGEHGS